MACPVFRPRIRPLLSLAFKRTMKICPVDLEYCAREECAAGVCEQSNEIALFPCVDCGVLVVRRGVGMCAECITIEITPTQES